MKKIMIAAAFACVAVVAQAASVSWSCTNVYAGNAETKANGVAYLMLESDMTAANFKALAGKGATAINGALGDALYSYTPSEAGKYTQSAVYNATLGLQDGKEYGNAYLVIFDTATVTDTSKFYVTNTKSLSTLEGDNTYALNFLSQATNSKKAEGWAAAAAPEPTSGILLLLGMAGLALKRKRA